MHKGTATLITALALGGLFALAAAPAAALNPLVGYEGVDRGYFAALGQADHPKRVLFTQVVNSSSFSELDSIVIAVIYERNLDQDDVEGLTGRSSTASARVVATATIVKPDGTRHGIGTVRTRVRATDDEASGVKLRPLPVALELGDLVEWQVRFKRFPDIPGNESCDITTAIAKPWLLD